MIPYCPSCEQNQIRSDIYFTKEKKNVENRDFTPRKIPPDEIKSTLMATKSRTENQAVEGVGLRSLRSRPDVPGRGEDKKVRRSLEIATYVTTKMKTTEDRRAGGSKTHEIPVCKNNLEDAVCE